MKLAEIPADEAERLADLHALGQLDTPPDAHLDLLTEAIAEVFDVPRVVVTLVDSDRMWFKSSVGLDGFDSAPRDVGLCAQAINEPTALVVPDATADDRFADNPFVTGDFNLRFYAGVPIHGPNERAVGALALLDTRPRELSARQISLLQKFAAVVEAQLQH